MNVNLYINEQINNCINKYVGVCMYVISNGDA